MLGDKTFPVFALRDYFKKYTKYGITYIDSLIGTRILDDTNKPYDTLGERRLHIDTNLLYVLNKPIFTIEELIKSKKKRFVDSKGSVFSYKKKNFYKILCAEIQYMTYIDTFTYEVKPYSYQPVIYNSVQNIGEPRYCLLVNIDGGYLIYGFTDEYVKPTRRKL